MPIDKQIFDLPQADAKFLQAQLAIGSQISTIVQVEGYDLDFKLIWSRCWTLSMAMRMRSYIVG
jgi:hypothetical protein